MRQSRAVLGQHVDDARHVVLLRLGERVPPGFEFVGVFDARHDVREDAVGRLEAQPLTSPDPAVLGERGLERWRARQDSNLWPSAPEADALSS